MKQLLIFLLLFACTLSLDYRTASLDDITKDTVTVTVSGAVEQEGELEVPAWSTIGDVIDEAGLAEDADTDVLNRTMPVRDHDVINVPEKKEEARISINTADIEELITLPGIGEATARKIIAYREEHGLFQNISDLMRVSGIGESKFEKIKDLISL